MLSRTSLRLVTHAFVRPPHYRSIPSVAPMGLGGGADMSDAAGAVINRDMLFHQYREFYTTLKQSTLIDSLTIMSEKSYFESVKVADQCTAIGSTMVAMPLYGFEHRASEYLETMRYVRNATSSVRGGGGGGGLSTPGGSLSTLATYLQDVETIRCHSGDIVSLPTGVAIGHGPRTNLQAIETLKSVFEIDPFVDMSGDAPRESLFGAAPFFIFTLEQEGDAPPLGDYFGFAGKNIIIAWKDEHGMLAVDQYNQQLQQKLELINAIGAGGGALFGFPTEPLQVVYVEHGCHFLSFYGADQSNDVLVMKGFDRSIDSLAGAGLNPIPVSWSEMNKMGSTSLRSCVLMVRFLGRSGSHGILRRNRVSSQSRWVGHQIE